MNFPLPSTYVHSGLIQPEFISYPDAIQVFHFSVSIQTKATLIPATVLSPLVYSPQRVTMAVVGRRGSGKTRIMFEEIDQYLLHADKLKGMRKFNSAQRFFMPDNNKVLVWDNNDEYGQYFPNSGITIKGLKKWMDGPEKLGIIVPVHSGGSVSENLTTVLREFQNGALVIDGMGDMWRLDANIRMIIEAAVVTNRSMERDFIYVGNEADGITPRFFQNSDFVRFHRHQMPPSHYGDSVPISLTDSDDLLQTFADYRAVYIHPASNSLSILNDHELPSSSPVFFGRSSDKEVSRNTRSAARNRKENTRRGKHKK